MFFRRDLASGADGPVHFAIRKPGICSELDVDFRRCDRMNRARCGAWLIVAGFVFSTLGQANIEELKAKATLSNTDRAALTDWVSTQTQVLIGDNKPAARSALKGLRDSLEEATPAFEQVMRTAASQELGRAIPAAKPLAAMQLAALLGDLGGAEALSPLLAALKSDQASVRAAAAGSLLRLQSALVAAGGDVVTQALQGLEAAAMSENNPSTLMAIYRAMDYTRAQNAPNPNDNAAAVLRVLASRGTKAQAGELVGSGADDIGLEVFTKLKANESPEDKRTLLTALSWLMRDAVNRYTSDGSMRNPKGPDMIQVRNRIEHFMLRAERKLIELAGGSAPAETIDAALKRGGAVSDVKDAMNAWAGKLQGQVEGVLAVES